MRVLLPIDDIHRLRNYSAAWGTSARYLLLHTTHRTDYIRALFAALPLSFNMTAVALSLSRHQDLDRPAATSCWSRFELELPLPKR